MNDNTQRIEQFRAEVADMKLRDPATGLDRLLVRLGVVGLVTGLGFGVAAWFISHGTRNPLQQRDAIVVALLGLTIAVVSGALFVKGALAGLPPLLDGPPVLRAAGPGRPHRGLGGRGHRRQRPRRARRRPIGRRPASPPQAAASTPAAAARRAAARNPWAIGAVSRRRRASGPTPSRRRTSPSGSFPSSARPCGRSPSSPSCRRARRRCRPPRPAGRSRRPRPEGRP